jgi:hypothetical protein
MYLPIAAVNNEETADEEADESLACFRSACFARPPGPIAITRQTQLLSWIASQVGEADRPPSCITLMRFS